MMIRAELLGLVTTTATKVAALTAAIALLITQATFVFFLPALERGDIGPGAAVLGDDLPSIDMSTAAAQLDALSPLGASAGGGSLGAATLAVTLLGVIAGTSDFRFGGIVAAALAAPRRRRLMVAKAAATGLAGLIVGAALSAVSAITLLGTLAVAGIPLAVDPLAAVGVLARGAVAVACLILIGLGIGMIVRNQLSAVVLMLALLLLEPIVQTTAQFVAGSLPGWTQLMPVALAQTAIGTGASALPPGIAVVALLAVTGITLSAATAVLQRSDL